MKTLFRWLVVWILALFAAAAEAEAPDQRRGPFPQGQLQAMLAPIAFYPDALLSQILMAASYPRDVAEAARWSGEHSGIQGEEAVRQVQDAPWDPSVLSLVAFPQILALMAERPRWTEDLGQAFVAQPREVMDAIQQIRARADAAGTLQSNDEVLVERQGYDYVIEPAVPGFLYGIPIGTAFWFGALDWPHRYVYYHSRPWYYHGHDYRHGERWRHDGNRHWAGHNDGRSRDGQRDRGTRNYVTRPAAPTYAPNAAPRARPTYRNERTETNAEVRNPASRAAPVERSAPATTERAAPERSRDASANPAERGARVMQR